MAQPNIDSFLLAIRESNAKLMGEGYRKYFVAATGQDTTNTFYKIYIVADAVFTTLSDAGTSLAGIGDPLNAQTIPANDTLQGEFTNVDLASGIIIAFSDSPIA